MRPTPPVDSAGQSRNRGLRLHPQVAAGWSRRIVASGRVLAVGLCSLFIACASAVAATAPASTIPLPSADPFYAWAGSLKHVKPGTVLRSRPVTLPGATFSVPTTASQVLYRTSGELGQPTVTVATIVHPLGSTKIVSYQMAYDALGAQCDPSYTLRGGDSTATSNGYEMTLFVTKYVDAGDTVVIPDYEGEHLDYVAGQEEGYDTLDGITAAEKALKLPAATRVGMVGYSGGAIATPFAGELASKYAPRLNIVGEAEGGVLVDIEHNLGYVNGTKDWSGAVPAALIALGRAFGITNTRQYESAYGQQVANQVKHECIVNFLGAYPGLKIAMLVKPPFANIYSVPEITKIANRLIMGRARTPKWPVFIATGNADGTGDGVMIAGDEEALAHTYCSRGTPVEFSEYQGESHMVAVIPFEARAFTLLSSELNGDKVANGCSAIRRGNSLAPLPVPSVRLSLLRTGQHRVTIRASTNGVTIKALVIRLRRGGKVISTRSVAQLTARKRTLVLHTSGTRLSAGRYSLTVTQAGATVWHHRLTIG
jgi:hypothetical protein